MKTNIITAMKHENIIAAAVLAVGLVAMGWTLKMGMDRFTNKDRQVTVKGLAEREVAADKVTWPIATKELGNDLPTLYDRIAATEQRVRQFLTAGGIKDAEIQTGAPQVEDLQANQYNNNEKPYRYIVTSVVTVTSRDVARVRRLIARQGELLKQGVAVVASGYDNPVKYEYVAFARMKPQMMREAIANAEKTAAQFAENSHSTLDKIMKADQGQFSIDDRDANTPYIKKVRVVSTVTYSLKD